MKEEYPFLKQMDKKTEDFLINIREMIDKCVEDQNDLDIYSPTYDEEYRAIEEYIEVLYGIVNNVLNELREKELMQRLK